MKFFALSGLAGLEYDLMKPSLLSTESVTDVKSYSIYRSYHLRGRTNSR